MTVDPPPPPGSRPGYRVQTIGAYGAQQNEQEPPKRSGPSLNGLLFLMLLCAVLSGAAYYVYSLQPDDTSIRETTPYRESVELVRINPMILAIVGEGTKLSLSRDSAIDPGFTSNGTANIIFDIVGDLGALQAFVDWESTSEGWVIRDAFYLTPEGEKESIPFRQDGSRIPNDQVQLYYAIDDTTDLGRAKKLVLEGRAMKALGMLNEIVAGRVVTVRTFSGEVLPSGQEGESSERIEAPSETTAQVPAEAWMWRGRAFHELENYAQAKRNYKRALENKEKLPLARTWLDEVMRLASPPPDPTYKLLQRATALVLPPLGKQPRLALRGQPLIDFIATLEPWDIAGHELTVARRGRVTVNDTTFPFHQLDDPTQYVLESEDKKLLLRERGAGVPAAEVTAQATETTEARHDEPTEAPAAAE